MQDTHRDAILKINMESYMIMPSIADDLGRPLMVISSTIKLRDRYIENIAYMTYETKHSDRKSWVSYYFSIPAVIN